MHATSLNLTDEREWLFSSLSHYKGRAAFALALFALALVFASGLMFVSGFLIDAAATRPYSIFVLHVPLALVQVFGIGKPLIEYVQKLSSHDFALRATSFMRRRLFQTIEKLYSVDGSQLRSGDALQSFSDDIEHLQNLYIRSLLPLVGSYLIGFILLVFLGCFSWKLLIAVLIALVLCFALAPLLFLFLTRPLLTNEYKLAYELSDTIVDSIEGSLDLRCAHNQTRYLTRVKELNDRLMSARMTRKQRTSAIELACNCVTCVLIAAVALISASLLSNGSGANFEWDSLNYLASFCLFIFPLSSALCCVAECLTQYINSKQTLSRLDSLSEKASVSEMDAAWSDSEDGQTQPQKPFVISVEDIRFAFGDAAPLFDDFSLTIPAGQHVAIVGPSGSGKSSLAQLLYGSLKPSHGDVKVGGCSSFQYWLQHNGTICLLSQEPYLFHSSIADNLRLAKPDASDAELSQVLRKVGLGKFANIDDTWGRNMYSSVEEAGSALSGGERHRLALARVLLSNADIIILDEPFASLDPELETTLISLTKTMFSHKTLLLITHHLTGVMSFDRVIYLRHGKIVMDDSPEHLRDTNEEFGALLRMDYPFAKNAKARRV